MRFTSFVIATFLSGCILTVEAQRFFSIESDSLRRSYLLASPQQELPNLPMVILLHDSHILPMTLAKLEWSRLRQPALVVFPVGLRNQWASGNHADSLRWDENFLLKIIFQVQQNFKTDISRIFILGMGNAFSLAESFQRKHPTLVRAAAPWKASASPSFGKELPEPARQLDSLAANNPSRKINATTEHFAFERQGETARPYAGHLSLALHLGRWQQAPGSRTVFDSTTLVDLADYHFMFGFQIAYHFTEKWSAYVESDFMIIPKERNINSISWGGGQGVQVKATGRGGVIIPYGIGVRYALPRDNFRPFFTTAFGQSFMYIGGGKASGGTGGLKQDITTRQVNVFRYALGTGFDLRVANSMSLQVEGKYTLSSRIDPALASVDRFQGFYMLIGLLFILGK